MYPVTPSRQGGGLMIEVLVTIAIVVIGLWGLMDVQSRLQRSEMESYQRTQALILLNDMSNRMTVNRLAAAGYVTNGMTPSYVGVGMTCAGAPSGLAATDMAQWCQQLQGAAETSGANNVGAMVGGRGCIQPFGTEPNTFMVTVVWQGLTPVSSPPTQVDCGAGLYDLPAGSDCAVVAEACRRYVTTIVRVGNLLVAP